MNITYIKLLKQIQHFADNHKQVKRFESDFLEQFENFSTVDDSFPLLYAVPNNNAFYADLYTALNDITLTLYCVDLIQEDRENINTILNTTSLILNDLHKYFRDQEIDGIDILSTSILTPVNNYLMDKVAGWQMTVTFQLESYSPCDIPLISDDQPPVPTCQPVHIIDSDGETEYDIPAGGSFVCTNALINPSPGNYIPGTLQLPWNSNSANVSIAVDGEITKTTGGGQWDGGADFIIEKSGNFILNFNLVDTVNPTSTNIMAGIDYFKANSQFNYTGIDMCFYRSGLNVQIFENGDNAYVYPSAINDATQYTIQRSGNFIFYKIDSVTVRTVTIINTGKMFFTSSIFNQDASIQNINITY